MFAEPFNWCDTRCERCPLRPRCPVAVKEDTARERGEAVDLGASLALAQEALETALRELAELNDPYLAPHEAPEEVRWLDRIGVVYATALMRLADAAPLHADPVALDDLRHHALLLARKCSRLALQLDDTFGDDDIFERDGAPNLLLLEIVAAGLRALIDGLFEASYRPAFEAIHAELDRLFGPLFAKLTPAVRAELARRIANGDAPSPFAVTT